MKCHYSIKVCTPVGKCCGYIYIYIYSTRERHIHIYRDRESERETCRYSAVR